MGKKAQEILKARNKKTSNKIKAWGSVSPRADLDNLRLTGGSDADREYDRLNHLTMSDVRGWNDPDTTYRSPALDMFSNAGGGIVGVGLSADEEKELKDLRKKRNRSATQAESLMPQIREINNDGDRLDDVYKAWAQAYDNGEELPNEYARKVGKEMSEKYKAQDNVLRLFDRYTAETERYDKRIAELEKKAGERDQNGVYIKNGEVDYERGKTESQKQTKLTGLKSQRNMAGETNVSSDDIQSAAVGLPASSEAQSIVAGYKANTGKEAAARSEERAYDYYGRNKDNTYGNDLLGRALGNIMVGDIGIKTNQAGKKLYDANSNDLEAVGVYQTLANRITQRNKQTFTNNNDFDRNWATFFNYVPQFVEQTKHRLAGMAVGATLGAMVGGGVGAKEGAWIGGSTAVAKFMFDQTAGAAYIRHLQNSGLSVEDAKKLASSEAIPSSLIEFGLDFAISGLFKGVGGTAGKIMQRFGTNAGKIEGGLVKGLMRTGLKQRAAETAISAVKSAGKTALSGLGEGAEEWLQSALEKTADRAAQRGQALNPLELVGKSLDFTQYTDQDLAEMNQDFLGGALIGLVGAPLKAGAFGTLKKILNVASEPELGKQVRAANKANSTIEAGLQSANRRTVALANKVKNGGSGILGNWDLGRLYKAVTREQYRAVGDIVGTEGENLTALVNEGLSHDEGTDAHKIAQDIRDKQNSGGYVAQNQVDALVAANDRAEAAATPAARTNTRFAPSNASEALQVLEASAINADYDDDVRSGIVTDAARIESKGADLSTIRRTGYNNAAQAVMGMARNYGDHGTSNDIGKVQRIGMGFAAADDAALDRDYIGNYADVLIGVANQNGAGYEFTPAELANDVITGTTTTDAKAVSTLKDALKVVPQKDVALRAAVYGEDPALVEQAEMLSNGDYSFIRAGEASPTQQKIAQAIQNTLDMNSPTTQGLMAESQTETGRDVVSALTEYFERNGEVPERFAPIFTDGGAAVSAAINRSIVQAANAPEITEGATNNVINGSIPKRTDNANGNMGRAYDERASEPSGSVYSGTGTAEAGRQAETVSDDRGAYTESLRESGYISQRQVNTAEGVITYNEISPEALADRADAQEIIERNAARGIDTVFFADSTNGARGFLYRGTSYIQYNNTKYTPSKINEHEYVHAKADTPAYTALKNAFVSRMTEEDRAGFEQLYATMSRRYGTEAMGYLQRMIEQNPRMSATEQGNVLSDYILQEIIADLNAGMDEAGQYSERFANELGAFRWETMNEAQRTQTAEQENTSSEAAATPAEYAEETDAGGVEAEQRAEQNTVNTERAEQESGVQIDKNMLELAEMIEKLNEAKKKNTKKSPYIEKFEKEIQEKVNSMYIDPESNEEIFGESPDAKAVSTETDAGGRFSFAGEKAKAADTSLLQQAQQMEQSGAAPEEIWKETVAEERREKYPKSMKPDADRVFAEGSDARFSKADDIHTPQFKEWFGDWENDPEHSSKVVNEDGTPKVVYHQTAGGFTVFDTKQKGAGTSDHETPFGVFMKSSDKDIGLRGKTQMALYADIKNPLIANNRHDLTAQLRRISPEYSVLLDEKSRLDEEYQIKFDQARNAVRNFRLQWRKDNPEADSRSLYDVKAYNELDDKEDQIIEEWTTKADNLSTQAKTVLTRALRSAGYDGVILHNDVGSFGRSTDAYIALDPTQIKSATDNIGTYDKTNPDIRYSIDFNLDDETWDALSSWDKLIEKYGAIPAGENPARDVTVPKRISKYQYVSRGARTLMEAGITPDDTISEFEKRILDGTMTHEVITNKDAAAWTRKQIEYHGFADALKKWESYVEDGKVGKREMALGMELYNQAVTNKDIPTAMKLAAELVAESTNAGQALQSVRMLKKMTPDGQLYYLEKSIEKMSDEFKQKLGDRFEGIEIDEDLIRQFLEAQNEQERNKVYDQICQNIADQIPATMMDKWNSWRYLAMLGNPRTHIRNIFGNLAFVPAMRINNYVGAVIERASKVPVAERTRSFKKSKAAVEFAKKDFAAMEKTLQGENAKYAVTGDIESKRTIFTKWKWLEALRRKNFKWLEGEDLWFLKRHYIDALARIITARELDVNSLTPDQLDRVRAFAVKEAQEATYRDANALADWLNRQQRRLDRSPNRALRAVSILAEGVMPFKKTPLNIAKQGIQYSPASILSGIYKVIQNHRNGNVYDTTEIINNFSKGLTGTGIILLGALLARMGILRTGKDDDDKKRNAFGKIMGEQNYSLVIAGKSYTIDWMVPASLPLFIGVNMTEQSEKGVSFSQTLNAMSSIAEPLMELSVFSGISDAIESAQYSQTNPVYDIMSNMATSYVLQAFPTAGGQLSRIIDSKKRNYYYTSKNSNLPAGIQTLIGRAASKIPGASFLFEPTVDVWGNEETYGGLPERILENLVSPGYFASESNDKVNTELMRLYERTGENAVFPPVQQKYFVEGKQHYYMSAKEYTEVKRYRGKESYKAVSALIGSGKFKSASDEEKIKAIKKCYDDAGKAAKDKYLKTVKEKAAKK